MAETVSGDVPGLKERLRDDRASSVALMLRLNAADCAQLAHGLTGMGSKFDTLRERVVQWGAAMLKGEAMIEEMRKAASHE